MLVDDWTLHCSRVMSEWDRGLSGLSSCLQECAVRVTCFEKWEVRAAVILLLIIQCIKLGLRCTKEGEMKEAMSLKSIRHNRVTEV